MGRSWKQNDVKDVGARKGFEEVVKHFFGNERSNDCKLLLNNLTEDHEKGMSHILENSFLALSH